MKTLTILTIVSVMMLTGCMTIDRPVTIAQMPKVPKVSVTTASEPDPVPAVNTGDAAVAKRFAETTEELPSAVENALMWSKRYDDLSRTCADLREKNNSLTVENAKLKQQTAKAVADLSIAQKELADANEFMAQMHSELAQWKKDVLGFRDEMRSAQSTQLKALSGIMKTLGAEPMETKSDE